MAKPVVWQVWCMERTSGEDTVEYVHAVDQADATAQLARRGLIATRWKNTSAARAKRGAAAIVLGTVVGTLGLMIFLAAFTVAGPGDLRTVQVDKSRRYQAELTEGLDTFQRLGVVAWVEKRSVPDCLLGGLGVYSTYPAIVPGPAWFDTHVDQKALAFRVVYDMNCVGKPSDRVILWDHRTNQVFGYYEPIGGYVPVR